MQTEANPGIDTIPMQRAPAQPAAPAQQAESGPARYASVAAGIAILAGAATLYIRTLAPSVMPGDYAEFQMSAAILGVPHPTGYPLYVLLGKLFTMLPFGDVAYRVNLSSAVYMSGATAMLFAVAARLLKFMRLADYWWAAFVGAVFFALAPTVWSMALVARSYALNALLVACVVFALISWRRTHRTGWFCASTAFIGLSLVHHGSTYFLLPAYGLFLLFVELERRRQRADTHPWRRRGLGVLTFLAGCSPILFLVYRFVYGSPYYWGNPTSWKDFFNLLGGGPFQGQVIPLNWPGEIDRFLFGAGQLSDQFTAVGIAAGLLGLIVLWRYMSAEAGLLTLMMAGNFGFASHYALVGYLYYIPTYLIWGVLIGVAVGWSARLVVRLFAGKSPRRAEILVAITAGLACLLTIPFAVDALSTRYPNLDLSKQTQVRDRTLALLNDAPRGAAVYLDWEDVSVVRFYRLVYGLRPDLAVHTDDPADWAKGVYCDVSNGVAAYVGKFAGAFPPAIESDFTTQPVPIGLRVLAAKDAAKYDIPPCGLCATCR